MGRDRERIDPAAEAWRAALPRRRRGGGGLVVLLALLLLAAGGLYAHARMSSSPPWVVRQITVMGNRSLSTAEILDRLGVNPGTPWWRVRSRSAVALREREPRLAEVSLAYAWPRDLVVRVRERESFLRLLSEPPLTMATDGVLLAENDQIDPADLPLLSGLQPGLSPGRRVELPGVEGAWKEFARLSGDCPEVWKSISEIEHAGGRQFRVFLRDGHRVLLWEAGTNEELKAALPEILSDLARHGQLDVVVDLRFRDQVVLRLPDGALVDSTGAALGSQNGAGGASGRQAAVGPATRGPKGSGHQGRRRA